jgi:hypothetical protein
LALNQDKNAENWVLGTKPIMPALNNLGLVIKKKIAELFK